MVECPMFGMWDLEVLAGGSFWLVHIVRVTTISNTWNSCLLKMHVRKEIRWRCGLWGEFYSGNKTHMHTQILNKDIGQDEKIMGVKLKKRLKNWGVFANDLVLILQEPQSGIEHVMKKLKDFSALAGFKLNKQKQRCWLRLGIHMIKRLVKTIGLKLRRK